MPTLIRTVRPIPILIFLVLVLTTRSASAQCNLWGCQSRGTLFHWGEGFTGGPDLSEPIVTDRPDFTEASSTVGLGVTQIELGYTYTEDEVGGIDTTSNSYPEPLLRMGILANWLELRAATTHLDQTVGAIGASGLTDLYLGFKIGLTPQQGWLPEMALIPQATVGTGDANFTADEFLPGANLIYAWDINDTLSLAGSTQFNRALDDFGDKYTEWAQSVAVGVGLTDNLGFYAEYFSILPGNDTGFLDEHYLNGGFTALLTNDILWDIRLGYGLNEAADDIFAGTGLSIRFR